MKDTIRRFMLEDTDLRGEIVHLSDSFFTIMEQHYYPEPVRKFLGEVLLSVVLLRGTIKFEGHLTIQLEDQGPISLLVADCDDQYHVRAVAQYDEQADLTELETALESGKLVVTIMPNNRVDPYQAIVPVDHGSVAKAIEFYFKQSEQMPTRIWFSVDKEKCAGLLLQKLPHSGEIGTNDWEKLFNKPDKVSKKDLLNQNQEELLVSTFGDGKVSLFKPSEVKFYCGCTVEKMAENIRLLGKEEAYDLLKQNRYITVTCEFCNHEHDFEKDAVDQIFK